MGYLVEFYIHIAWIEIEALLAFSLEEDHIAIFHTFLEVKLQVSWVDEYLVSSANWTLVARPESASSAGLAFHLHLLHLILHLHLSEHLPASSAARTGLLLSALVTGSLAVLADLSPSEAVDLLASCVKLIERDPHLRPEVSSLPQWIFLEFFEPCLAVQIIGDSFGDIDQDLVGPFDLHILLLHLLIACVSIGMVLDGQPPE